MLKGELQTVTERGLNHSMLPMRLYHKAKKLGIWDPRDIDLTQDRADWESFTEAQKLVVLRLCVLFQAGEEAVTRELLPLIHTISREGRLEEEMFLTTFLWEEAKHTELFRRFLDEVAMEKRDLTDLHGSHYRAIFYDRLPDAMERLLSDTSMEAQVEASVTYNMVVEGVLAETGYHAFFNMLQRNGKMPGLVKAIGYLKQDESRHIGYGTYLLSRFICENEGAWDHINECISALMPDAIGVIGELFEILERDYPEITPDQIFDIDQYEFVEFAMKQFQIRMDVLERARGRSIDEIYQLSESAVGMDVGQEPAPEADNSDIRQE